MKHFQFRYTIKPPDGEPIIGYMTVKESRKWNADMLKLYVLTNTEKPDGTTTEHVTIDQWKEVKGHNGLR